MSKSSLYQIVETLNNAQVQYLLSSGLACLARDFDLPTLDVDLLLQLNQTNVPTALRALQTLGYAPTIPIHIEDFANATIRQSWITDKRMKMFRLYSDIYRETSVNIFAGNTPGTDRALKHVRYLPLTRSLHAPICGLDLAAHAERRRSVALSFADSVAWIEHTNRLHTMN